MVYKPLFFKNNYYNYNHWITIKASRLDIESKVCVGNWAFLLTNQKFIFPPQPI